MTNGIIEVVTTIVWWYWRTCTCKGKSICNSTVNRSCCLCVATTCNGCSVFLGRSRQSNLLWIEQIANSNDCRFCSKFIWVWRIGNGKGLRAVAIVLYCQLINTGRKVLVTRANTNITSICGTIINGERSLWLRITICIDFAKISLIGRSTNISFTRNLYVLDVLSQGSTTRETETKISGILRDSTREVLITIRKTFVIMNLLPWRIIRRIFNIQIIIDCRPLGARWIIHCFTWSR